jgi:hypothetical protein
MTSHSQHRFSRRSVVSTVVFAALCLSPSSRLLSQTPSTTTANPVQLTLASKIDSKSAKAGDAVVTKTTSKMEFGGVSYPTATRLAGKITAANHQPASISIELDSLERKGQPALPVQAVIVAIAPAAEADTAMSLPSGKTGYTNSANPASKDSNSASDLTETGSSIKNVTLKDNTLTSDKDFKLGSGIRMAATLAAPAK